MRSKEITENKSKWRSSIKRSTRICAMALAVLVSYLGMLTFYSNGMIIGKDMEAYAATTDDICYYHWHKIHNHNEMIQYLKASSSDKDYSTCKSPNPVKVVTDTELGTYEYQYQDWHRVLILYGDYGWNMWGDRSDWTPTYEYMMTRNHCVYDYGYYGVRIKASDNIATTKDEFVTRNNFHTPFMKYLGDCSDSDYWNYADGNSGSVRCANVAIRWQNTNSYPSWIYEAKDSKGEGYVPSNSPMWLYHQNNLYGGASSANYNVCIETGKNERGAQYRDLSCLYGGYERNEKSTIIWATGKPYFGAKWQCTGRDVTWKHEGDHIWAGLGMGGFEAWPSDIRNGGYANAGIFYYAMYIATLESMSKYTAEVVFEDGVDNTIEDLIIDYATTVIVKKGATLHLVGNCQLLGDIVLDGGILIIEDNTNVIGVPAVRMAQPKNPNNTLDTTVSQIKASNASQIYIGNNSLLYLPTTCFDNYAAVNGGMKLTDSTVYNKGIVVLGSYLEMERSTWQQPKTASGQKAATYVGMFLKTDAGSSYSTASNTGNLRMTESLANNYYVGLKLNASMLIYDGATFLFAGGQNDSNSGIWWQAPPVSRQAAMKKYESSDNKMYTSHKVTTIKDVTGINQLIKDYSFGAL